jgi:predicted ATPase
MIFAESRRVMVIAHSVRLFKSIKNREKLLCANEIGKKDSRAKELERF